MSERKIKLIPPEGAEGALYFIDEQYLFQHASEQGLSSKYVSAASVRNAFSNAPIDSGWLPQGVCRWITGARGSLMVRWHNPATYKIHIDGEKKPLTVPMPSLIWVGFRTSYWIYAAREKTIKPNAALYHPPVPNSDGSGQVCFGANAKRGVAKGGFEGAWQLFWDAPFNGHHASGKSKKQKDNILVQLKAVAKSKASTYPLEDLVSMGRNLDSAIRQFAETGSDRYQIAETFYDDYEDDPDGDLDPDE